MKSNDKIDGIEKSDDYRARADRDRAKRIVDFLESFGAPVESNPDDERSHTDRDVFVPKWDIFKFLTDGVTPPAPDFLPDSVDSHEGHRDRLRRAVKLDRDLNTLSDSDIIETLLSYFIPRKDTAPIARAMINSFGSVGGVLSASPDELYAFSGMTRSAAELLPVLAAAVASNVGDKIAVTCHRGAAELMAMSYLGGERKGTLAVFLDSDFFVLGVEKLRGPELIPVSAVIGSAYKYNARYVIIGRRDDEIISTKFALVNDIDRAADALRRCGYELLDCLLFNDYGYYTLGSTAVGKMSLELCAVPFTRLSRSPELIGRVERAILQEEERETDGEI